MPRALLVPPAGGGIDRGVDTASVHKAIAGVDAADVTHDLPGIIDAGRVGSVAGVGRIVECRVGRHVRAPTKPRGSNRHVPYHSRISEPFCSFHDKASRPTGNRWR